jgi:MinD superfamily P-loop ATPase
MPATDQVSATLPILEARPEPSPPSELVVISGKGGTGKTSLVASFAALERGMVLADCDVDAADLHLVLRPEIVERHRFVAGTEAVIRAADCTDCGVCTEVCRFGAIGCDGDLGLPVVDPIGCEGCGVCAHLCPEGAIDLEERTCGEWFVSDTRCGPMVHARLGIAAENSGKLVTLVREQARRMAAARGRRAVLIDGPPGIGCPVIAAVTGASAVLVVTEPTVSGRHDLERVLELTRHFGITTAVCVNRWDLHPENSEAIEDAARELGAIPVGRVRYDAAVTRAQVAHQSVVELGGAAAEDVEVVWEWVTGLLAPASATSQGQ